MLYIVTVVDESCMLCMVPSLVIYVEKNPCVSHHYQLHKDPEGYELVLNFFSLKLLRIEAAILSLYHFKT